MSLQIQQSGFPLGKLVMTRGIADSIAENKEMSLDIVSALARYTCKDWGDTCAEDKALNDEALIEGDRLLAVYDLPCGKRIWIITEADRSATTILFPEEY